MLCDANEPLTGGYHALSAYYRHVISKHVERQTKMNDPALYQKLYFLRVNVAFESYIEYVHITNIKAVKFANICEY